MPNEAQLQKTHFWVSSYPFCEAMLFLCPHHEATDSALTRVRFFDCDGQLVTEAELGSSIGAPSAIEIDPLLERCKLESGMRHGHLLVEHDARVRPVCRLQNRAGAVISGCSQAVTQDHALFSPVTLAPERLSMVTLVNHSEVATQVRVRLMFGNRNPDVVCTVAGNGTSIICLEREFLEALTTNFGKNAGSKKDVPLELKNSFPETRAYVRISVRSEQAIGAQLVECVERPDTGPVFTALSW